MTTIKQDIEALRALVAPKLPASTKFSLQKIPDQPAGGILAIQIASQSSAVVTGAHKRYNRTYQFVYFGSTNIDVIDRMDEIQRAIDGQTKVLANNGTEHITLGAFSLSQRVKAENGTEAMIGLLEVEAFEQRTIASAPKITGVQTNVTSTPSN